MQTRSTVEPFQFHVARQGNGTTVGHWAYFKTTLRVEPFGKQRDLTYTVLYLKCGVGKTPRSTDYRYGKATEAFSRGVGRSASVPVTAAASQLSQLAVEARRLANTYVATIGDDPALAELGAKATVLVADLRRNLEQMVTHWDDNGFLYHEQELVPWGMAAAIARFLRPLDAEIGRPSVSVQRHDGPHGMVGIGGRQVNHRNRLEAPLNMLNTAFSTTIRRDKFNPGQWHFEGEQALEIMEGWRQSLYTDAAFREILRAPHHVTL